MTPKTILAPFTCTMGNSSAKLPYTPSSRKITSFRHPASIWTIYEGTDGATLIFRHEKKGAKPLDTVCAQNALKRLRTMRHPYILKLLVSHSLYLVYLGWRVGGGAIRPYLWGTGMGYHPPHFYIPDLFL